MCNNLINDIYLQCSNCERNYCERCCPSIYSLVDDLCYNTDYRPALCDESNSTPEKIALEKLEDSNEIDYHWITDAQHIAMYKCQYCCNNPEVRRFTQDDIINFLLEKIGQIREEVHDEMLAQALGTKSKNAYF